MTEPEKSETATRSEWKKTIKIIAYMLPWLAVWLWLKSKTGFPDSFGYHNGLHGKAGVFNEYIHSQLLLERPDFWDLVLFAWMWLPIAGFVCWIAYAIRSDLRSRNDRGEE